MCGAAHRDRHSVALDESLHDGAGDAEPEAKGELDEIERFEKM